MTDDELRAIGREFIEGRVEIGLKRLQVEIALDPVVGLKLQSEWDYIDPLRMGVFLLTKAVAGAWVIEYDHIRKVCLNTNAFKQSLDGARARVGELGEESERCLGARNQSESVENQSARQCLGRIAKLNTSEDGQNSSDKLPEKKPRPKGSTSDGTSGHGTESWWEILGSLAWAALSCVFDLFGDDD